MKAVTHFILFLIGYLSFAQVKVARAELIDMKLISADLYIGYDKFDFFYYIKNNTLFKIKNDYSLEYKNVPLGQISKVDLLNPLKVIVFYDRFNTAVTLDNNLNETLKVNFSELKVPLVVTKIGIAAQHQLWVFDEITNQIYLYSSANGTLKSVGTPLSEPIVFYNSDFNSFEWLDAKNNWYACSLFGAIQKLDYQIDFDKILFSDHEFIMYSKGENVFIFTKKSKEIIKLENIEKSFRSLTFKNQILSIFTNQGISNYKIIIP